MSINITFTFRNRPIVRAQEGPATKLL